MEEKKEEKLDSDENYKNFKTFLENSEITLERIEHGKDGYILFTCNLNVSKKIFPYGRDIRTISVKISLVHGANEPYKPYKPYKPYYININPNDERNVNYTVVPITNNNALDYKNPNNYFSKSSSDFESIKHPPSVVYADSDYDVYGRNKNNDNLRQLIGYIDRIIFDKQSYKELTADEESFLYLMNALGSVKYSGISLIATKQENKQENKQGGGVVISSYMYNKRRTKRSRNKQTKRGKSIHKYGKQSKRKSKHKSMRNKKKQV